MVRLRQNPPIIRYTFQRSNTLVVRLYRKVLTTLRFYGGIRLINTAHFISYNVKYTVSGELTCCWGKYAYGAEGHIVGVAGARHSSCSRYPMRRVELSAGDWR